MNLYLTADSIGVQTGGGLVTHHECQALRTVGPCEVWDRGWFQHRSVEGTFVATADTREPWYWDAVAANHIDRWSNEGTPRLCHIYAGTWGKTVRALKDRGCKVVVTVAAHDKEVSRREHEALGVDFASTYPHLIDGPLWDRYVEGYRLADCLVCPGTVPAETVRRYGPAFRDKWIEVIPHGCEMPECDQCLGLGTWVEKPDNPICPACQGSSVATIAPLPARFTVGYLGALGPDKGVRYLLEAWGKLNYRDALLVLAGRDSTSDWAKHLYQQVGGGSVHFQGWVDDVSEFYNGISLYVQPSVTEGFGCEVLEALSHGRRVLCSDAAGAQDLVPGHWRFPARNVNELAGALDYVKTEATRKPDLLRFDGETARTLASKFTWTEVRRRYVELWRRVLAS